MTQNTKKEEHKMQHYLLTVDVVPQRVRAHSYLTCPDDTLGVDVLGAATEKLLDVAEGIARELGTRLLPIILSTRLTGGEKVVREIVRREVPGARDKLRKPKKDAVYRMMWVWDTRDNPDDARLMALH
jgi:CBS-domain-containing membrane protein